MSVFVGVAEMTLPLESVDLVAVTCCRRIAPSGKFCRVRPGLGETCSRNPLALELSKYTSRNRRAYAVSPESGNPTNLALVVVAIDIIHFCQKKLVDDFGSLKIELSSLIPLG
jgi:hypothetical protein